MPGRYCSVAGCHNSEVGLKKWRDGFCNIHQINYGIGRCICEPPFRLFPFPTELQDPEGRQRWIKNVNRQDPKTGKIWIPSISGRICSKHFVDSEPSLSNPNPTLFMGHSEPSLGKRERRKIKKHDQPVSKKRKISCTDQEGSSASDKGATSFPQMHTDDLSENLASHPFEEEMSICEDHTYYKQSENSVLSDSDITCMSKTEKTPERTPPVNEKASKSHTSIRISLSEQLMKNDKKM